MLYWEIGIITTSVILITSIFALTIEDKNKSPENSRNKVANFLTKWVVVIGQGKVLYSSVFIYFLLTNYSIQNQYTLILFLLWAVILLIDPKKLKTTFSIRKKVLDENAIGEIFGVQSRKIFLVKLFEDRKSIKKFDLVKFRYSMQDAKDFMITGIVFDTYLLNQEKWAKVLQLGDPKKANDRLDKNIVYKVVNEEEINILNNELKVDNLVGVIIENSTIGKIKFEYSKREDNLQEGDLLELKVAEKRLFYQVIAGTTEKKNWKQEMRQDLLKVTQFNWVSGTIPSYASLNLVGCHLLIRLYLKLKQLTSRYHNLNIRHIN